ncbi:MAG: 16S rRNA (guanine(527)-N(7))-methyltransferase RsmG [Bacteroidetes bacterium]|nr:16S rRNA (guanine(527)-N(7))-methyltransferase RsmG [Bacteroidota bacterium]
MMIIKKYFPDISQEQMEMFEKLIPLYTEWNTKINVISRKDIENLAVNHILHSLAIAKVIQFKKGTTILDVGTGGGFPGIPLAILFPECDFHLIDSIGKKITVVEAVAEGIGLKNLTAEKLRVEDIDRRFNFIVSRAVTTLPEFYNWVKHLVLPKSQNELKNGIIYLKGGDLTDELRKFKNYSTIYNISDFFEEEFFETKKVIHIY